MFTISSQPQSGDQYVNIGTLGTTIVSDGGANLRKIIYPGTYVGSVYFFDSATIAGTAATNLVYTAGLPGLNHPTSVQVDIRFRNGIIATALGTPVLAFTWDK